MSFLENLLGVIAPPTCCLCGSEGTALCGGCTTSLSPVPSACFRCGKQTESFKVCPACRRVTHLRQVWISSYYDETARSIIKGYKFDHYRALSGPIARHMADVMTSSNYNPKSILVPVPTATGRVRERGFDHTATVCADIAKRLGLPWQPLLLRFGQSKQVGASRKQRLTQLENSYRVSSSATVAGRHIILVDDVITTGATIETAAKTLKAQGASSVSALIFAQKH
jgi:ComF family protein